MKNKKPQLHEKQKSTPIKKTIVWIIGVLVIGAALFLFWSTQNSEKETTQLSSASAKSATENSTTTQQDLPIGRWVRTDSEGAYILEIKSVGGDGKLDARYFNPNPIKIGYAEWKQEESNLIVLVELRDVNYPGSTYTLHFLPTENRLRGIYYQAVEKANFDVEFVRVNVK